MGDLILPPGFKKTKSKNYQEESEAHYARIESIVNKMMSFDENLTRERAYKQAQWQEIVHNRIMLDRLFKHLGVSNE